MGVSPSPSLWSPLSPGRAPWRLAMANTVPDRRSRAIRFGAAIMPLPIEATVQARSLVQTAPMKTTTHHITR